MSLLTRLWRWLTTPRPAPQFCEMCGDATGGYHFCDDCNDRRAW